MKTRYAFRYMAASLILLLTFLATAFVAAPSPALAGHHDRDDHVEARRLLQRGEILPLSRILGIVHKRLPGDVIEVELEHGHHGWEYEVKVLAADGRVRKVKLNAGSGVVRKIEDD